MDDLKNRFSEVEDWLIEAYSGIRSGQAAPALLDGIRVENYGALVPINQVGSIGIEDARTLRISTWDAGIIPAVEKAITNANLGVSLSTDSAGVRVSFPELTSERREQLIKLAKQKLEDARVSVKSIRDELMKDLDKKQKEGEISEDEKFTQRNTVQKLVDDINSRLEALYAKKETEIK